MKLLRNLCIVFMLCAPALAWDCTTSGQIRIQVPTGTLGSGTGDGSGQVVVDNGLTFECETLPTAPPPTTTTPSTSSSTSNSTSGATASSGSTSGATATGGNSSATGGQGGSSSSKSGVSGSGNSTVGVNTTVSPVITNNLANTLSHSGNSSNKNTNTATGGQGGTGGTSSSNQTQSQSNTSTNANNSAATATNNGSNSNNTTNNVEATKIPVASAYAPTALPSAPCVKSFGGGVQTMAIGGSFGGGKIDQGCDARELARSFSLTGSRIAACKVLVSTKQAKKAGVTFDDCMGPVVIAAPLAPVVIREALTTAPVAPIVNITVMPAPVMVLPAPPQYRTAVTVTAPKKRVIRHLPPQCQNVVQKACTSTEK